MRMVGALTAVPALIRRLGADPAAIFAAIALDPALLDHPSNRIAYVDLARLLNEASERTGCPHFGLLVGREWHLSNLGLPGEAVRHAPTLGQGLEEFILSHHLNSEGAVTFLMQRSGVAEFGYALFVPLGAGRRLIYDAAVATGMNMMRELCGDAWSPSEVLLAHTEPDDAEPYRQTFRAPVRFNSEYCAIRFPAHWLDHRVAGADPERLRLVRAKTAAAGKATLPQSVARTLRTLLLHGKASGADVALSLAMHRRTLNRRLSDEGTTFQRVLDGVRLSIAKELLEDSAVSLPDIAAALGYGDYVSLIRAFRRWTGTTPGAWRTSFRAQPNRE